MVPTRTRRPEEAGSPSASSSVTVSVRKIDGGTPAHSTTSSGSLNVPMAISTSSSFFNHAW